MGRPATPVGTFGSILFRPASGGRVRATTRVRDLDGRLREVSRVAGSRSAAERDLKSALTDRSVPGRHGCLAASTPVRELAEAWLASSQGWSTGTRRVYGNVVRNQIEPALGALRLREVSAGLISRTLAAVAASTGPSTAKTMRACLSGMFALAIEDGAVERNPVRDSGVRIPVERKRARALTAEQTSQLRQLFAGSDRALELDLPALLDWMLWTGCRIGEALATRHERTREGRLLLDLDAGTWEVEATVVRVPGQGLVIQRRPKTAAGWRTLVLPPSAVELARSRRELVFPAPVARTLRDPSNTSADLRQLLDSLDCEACNRTGYQLDGAGRFKLNVHGRRIRCEEGPWSWVTSHTFRKSVATRLDDGGLTARQVADQLGHANPSMTQDVYFGRQVVSSRAAVVLEESAGRL